MTQQQITLSYLEGMGYYWHTVSEPMAYTTGGDVIYTYGQRISKWYDTRAQALKNKPVFKKATK